MEHFYRVETDRYFSNIVAGGGFGKFVHSRLPARPGRETVVRMQQDTLYSVAVVDLRAGPVTVTLPETDGRFQSLMPLSQDHDVFPCCYGPGEFTFLGEAVGTRYMALLLRTFMNANDKSDVEAANSLQDVVALQQGQVGEFMVPEWDQEELTKIRDAAKVLFSTYGMSSGKALGLRKHIDPLSHLLVTAAGWGGNQAQDAFYAAPHVSLNDGKTPHTVTVRDVPMKARGFWSITVYGPTGFMIPNKENIHSFNNKTARPNSDGTVTIDFRQEGDGRGNCIPIVEGWSCCVRVYLPEASVLSGEWSFPAIVPCAGPSRL